jgi:hypothetical protein
MENRLIKFKKFQSKPPVAEQSSETRVRTQILLLRYAMSFIYLMFLDTYTSTVFVRLLSTKNMSYWLVFIYPYCFEISSRWSIRGLYISIDWLSAVTFEMESIVKCQLFFKRIPKDFDWNLCGIENVYTRVWYRGHGFALQVNRSAYTLCIVCTECTFPTV